MTVLVGRKSRAAAVAGGALVLAGAACERWAIYEAGFPSTRDPKYTVMPQRERLEGPQRGPRRVARKVT